MLSFKKREVPTFGGGKIIRYIHEKFEINASRQGICIAGECPMLSHHDDLEVLAETIAKAWQWHQQLKETLHGREGGFAVESEES